jgi:O-antigen/teichoic acid export membrane protein
MWNMKWLQNPAVALLELLASAIALAQSATRLCRYIYRLHTEAENERYRGIRIAAASAALVVVVVFSAATWSVIMAEAVKAGNPGLLGVLYPFQLDCLAFLGAVVLLEQARERQRFSPFACCLLGVSLATVAAGYLFSSGPTGWIGAAATSSVTNLVIVVLAYVFFQHLRRIRPGQVKKPSVMDTVMNRATK